MPKTLRRTGVPAVYQAMSVMVENGLRQDGSAFTPGAPVWTAGNFVMLRSHFIEQPDLGKGSYLKKLEGQMAGADDRAIQLMAELHYIHLLVPSTTSGKKKRQILDSILGFMSEPVAVPPSLAAALDHGFLNPGTFYLTRRDAQLAFLIEFGEAWKYLASEQSELLRDPWAFKGLFGSERGLEHP